jgi:hypothetical protein
MKLRLFPVHVGDTSLTGKAEVPRQAILCTSSYNIYHIYKIRAYKGFLKVLSNEN